MGDDHKEDVNRIADSDFPWEDDDEDPDDDGYDDDEDEDARNCGGFFLHGRWVCVNIGSEQCEFECPYSAWIGLTEKQIRNLESR